MNETKLTRLLGIDLVADGFQHEGMRRGVLRVGQAGDALFHIIGDPQGNGHKCTMYHK